MAFPGGTSTTLVSDAGVPADARVASKTSADLGRATTSAAAPDLGPARATAPDAAAPRLDARRTKLARKHPRRQPRRGKRPKVPPTKRGASPQKPPPVTPAAALGRLTIVAPGARRGTGTKTLRAPRGTMHVQGAFDLTLRYSVSGGRLVVSLDAKPFAIVYGSGLTPGRTPRHGITVDSRGRRLGFKSPEGASMVLVLNYDPAP